MTTTNAQTYELRVAGHLDDHWAASPGLPIARHDDGTSTLTGPVADQAQLHGILARLGDIGATLLSLRAVDDESRQSQPRPRSGGSRPAHRSSRGLDRATGASRPG